MNQGQWILLTFLFLISQGLAQQPDPIGIEGQVQRLTEQVKSLQDKLNQSAQNSAQNTQAMQAFADSAKNTEERINELRTNAAKTGQQLSQVATRVSQIESSALMSLQGNIPLPGGVASIQTSGNNIVITAPGKVIFNAGEVVLPNSK